MDSTVDSLRVRVDFFTEAPPSWSRRHKAEVGGACDGHFVSFLHHRCCSRHGKTVVGSSRIGHFVKHIGTHGEVFTGVDKELQRLGRPQVAVGSLGVDH
ncbi:hypothetical protein BHM03_00032616 [Ensete ventricosum]|nr:hypothetical protein BHM03_00032616 [Ensete ventricosum]